MEMVRIRRHVEAESAASTEFNEVAAGASNSQGPSPLLEASTRPTTLPSLGVRERGRVFHIEIRTHGCHKIHVARFGQCRELAVVAHDVARLCHLGEGAYLGLRKNKLNYWEERDVLAALFRGDQRMMELADAHRRKEGDRQNWDTDMKTRLRELASDALKLIKAKAQEEAAALQQSAGVDSQNNNGNLSLSGFSDEGSDFDIDDVLASVCGDAPENWPNTRESLRSITPELPELSFEDPVDLLWNEKDFAVDALNCIGEGN